MDATPDHFATTVEEAHIRAALERLTTVVQAVADNPAAAQALEMFLRDVRAAMVASQTLQRRVLIRALARHERQTLRIPDPEAGK
jgi:hypothetical protein